MTLQMIQNPIYEKIDESEMRTQIDDEQLMIMNKTRETKMKILKRQYLKWGNENIDFLRSIFVDEGES